MINTVTIQGIIADDSFEITKASGAVTQSFNLVIDKSFDGGKMGYQDRVHYLKCKWYGGERLYAGDNVVINGSFSVGKSDKTGNNFVYINVDNVVFINA